MDGDRMKKCLNCGHHQWFGKKCDNCGTEELL